MDTINNNVELDLNIGETFTSYDDFKAKILSETKKKFLQYYKRDSRTIEAAKRRNPKKNYHSNVKYAEVKFTCIHGGKKFKTEGKGIRKSSTFRKNCPAFIKAVANRNGLCIDNICNLHNHSVEKVLYQLLPHNRQLTPDVKRDVKELMRLKGNKKLIRKTILEKTNVFLTLRDISNLCRKDRKVKENDLVATVNKLKERGADVHILVEDSTFKGLFFCTSNMKQYMNAYPELICIDATFLLLNIRAPVYIILVEDGNGESLIVAVSILVSEDAESLRWFLKIFKETNRSWIQVKNIMADKDWNERDILKSEFPDAKILICIFHTFRIFQRAISCQKMNISNKERILALTLLQQIVYSKNEIDFENLKMKMESLLPPQILSYFNENWEPIKSEWCMFLGDTFSNFLNTTNNRLESLNSALKEVIEKYSTLQDFVDGLFTHLQSSQIELNVRSANMINKVPATLEHCNEFEVKYFQLLTGYAFQKLKPQFKFSEVKFSQVNQSCYKVQKSLNFFLNVTPITCTCNFFQSMNLPCKHIFAIRWHEKLPLFEPTLCKTRWTMNYYKSNHPLLKDANLYEDGGNCNVSSLELTQPKKLSKQQKFNKAIVKCKILASLAAEQCGSKFDYRIKELDNLIDRWKRDEPGQFTNYVESTNLDITQIPNISAEINIEDNNLEISDENVMSPSDNKNLEFVEGELEDCEIEILHVHEIMESNQPNLEINNISLEQGEDNLTISNGQGQLSETMDFQVEKYVTKLPCSTQTCKLKHLYLDVDRGSSINDQTNLQLYDEGDVKQGEGVEEALESVASNIEIAEIKIDPSFKQRGRPRGSNLTAIGITKKRKTPKE